MRFNIEAERVRNKMGKEELSEKMNISLKTYYNWINESTDIPGTKLLEMGKLFGVSMEYLLTSVPDERGVSMMEQEVKVSVDSSEMDEAIKKAKHLMSLIKEANALADELASKFPNVTIRI